MTRPARGRRGRWPARAATAALAAVTAAVLPVAAAPGAPAGAGATAVQVAAGRSAASASVPAAVAGGAARTESRAGAVVPPRGARATTAGSRDHSGCTPRLLVVSALPAEIDPLLARASLDPRPAMTVGGRDVFTGTLDGTPVVMGLTGIGPVNARTTTLAILDHFRCGTRPQITAVVFSGVSGGRSDIGDVTVPARWTGDGGTTWVPADPAMLGVAGQVAASGGVRLEQNTPTGDPACVCAPSVVTPVRVDQAPRIIVGGDGSTSDPFGGRALPCVPFGGDVFGCSPCHAPSRSAPDPVRFATGALPFVDPAFFTGYLEQSGAATPPYDAVDEETAAVASAVTAAGIPFIAFRALSDGKGDPLMLPGFPFQFFVYRQLAADNAAAMALAFLSVWTKTHGAPTGG